jgi:ribosomal protein L20
MELSIWATFITALAAIITAITAIITVIVQDRRSRYSQGVQVLMKLSDQFNSTEFKEKRKKFAKLILSKVKRNENVKELLLGEILDHFQLVGILLNKKVLNTELVHSKYFFWLLHYYYFSRNHIQRFRQAYNDPTAWEDVDKLFEKLSVVERKYRGDVREISPSEESMRDFLESEAHL